MRSQIGYGPRHKYIAVPNSPLDGGVPQCHGVRCLHRPGSVVQRYIDHLIPFDAVRCGRVGVRWWEVSAVGPVEQSLLALMLGERCRIGEAARWRMVPRIVWVTRVRAGFESRPPTGALGALSRTHRCLAAASGFVVRDWSRMRQRLDKGRRDGTTCRTIPRSSFRDKGVSDGREGCDGECALVG